jgi:hypothetical protein
MSMTRRDTIAEAILASRVLFHRYLAGFDDTNHTRQGPHLPNHAAWCLGHCALTLHRGVERINREPIPASDFFTPRADLAGKTPSPHATRTGSPGINAPSRYDAEAIAFGSTPVDNPAAYPRFARCVEIFYAACNRSAGVVRALPEEHLDAMIPWGQIQIPVWASGLRMAFHNGQHCGQVSDLRRAMGMKSIFA